MAFQNCHQKAIANCLLHGPPTKQYDEDVRKFVLTLYFHSPKAYKYVRNKFNNNLPHPSTIRKWYMNSSANGEPGLSKQSFQRLTQLANEQKKKGIELICSLIFDEMSIRKHLQWSDSEKKFLGHITYGFRPDNEDVPIANNAIVFMLNGINVDFTIPVAHYFIGSLLAVEKANLIQDVIKAISACGVRVLNISFDGLPCNFTTCELLGASFVERSFKPYFILPGDNRKTYIILDPPHMLKLARNCIGNTSALIEENGGRIMWKYFEEMEQFRIVRGYTLTHKMNKRHMHWRNFKMNVRMAAQTLSNSVATSMKYLMDTGHEEFSDASATIQYTEYINNVFDIMNTGKNTSHTNIFKNAINPLTADQVFAYFNEVIHYLRNITLPNSEKENNTKGKRKLIERKKVVESKKGTPFRGFIINMINLRFIYEEIVGTKIMDYLPTRKLNQDLLESFFGRIRSCLGFNDNPTVQQFGAAFRKIIINNDIKTSELANCQDILSLDILSVSSKRKNQNANHTLESEKENANGLKNAGNNNYVLNDLEAVSVAHLAGLIETKIVEKARFSCAGCLKIFAENDKIAHSSQSQLNNVPCQSTFDICSIAFKHVQKLAVDSSYTYEELLNDISSEFDINTAFARTSFERHEDHKEYFVTFIAEEYIRAQANYIAKKVTLQEQEILLGNRAKKIRQSNGQ